MLVPTPTKLSYAYGHHHTNMGPCTFMLIFLTPYAYSPENLIFDTYSPEN